VCVCVLYYILDKKNKNRLCEESFRMGISSFPLFLLILHDEYCLWDWPWECHLGRSRRFKEKGGKH